MTIPNKDTVRWILEDIKNIKKVDFKARNHRKSDICVLCGGVHNGIWNNFNLDFSKDVNCLPTE